MKVPDFLVRTFAKKSFKFFERYLKLHITPVHFYSPVPTTYEIAPSVFNKIYDCTGIDWNVNEQIANLELFHSKYNDEYIPAANKDRLSQLDSFMLYSIWIKRTL